MTEPEDVEEDLFADLYDADESTRPAAPVDPPVATESAPTNFHTQHSEPDATSNNDGQYRAAQPDIEHERTVLQGAGEQSNVIQPNISQQDGVHGAAHPETETQGTGIKEDGKMFIGGLNWETTDQSLRDYFSQFGEVQECTVMRDGASGRSRGFGFLTFKDPKTVNTVMVKEHYLDGKIIDPKRAIPRDEQERTSKIFVGGVSQEATEQDFKQFFMQFGRVVDATLMIDKDTGRPRGFGFVTFDSETAVEATLSRPLEILGKPIEVKKAQPRGNMRDDDGGRGGMRRGMRDDRFRDDDRSGPDGMQHQNAQGQADATSGMTPQMMAQYWQRMQQYFAYMQQQMALAAVQGQQMGGPGMAAMNPAMMQQMQQAQQMKQAQNMNAMTGGQPQPGMNPQSQNPGPQAMQGMMSPAMMQQMPIQNQSQGGAGYGGSGMGGQMGPGGASSGMGNTPNNMAMGGNFTGPRGGPGYNAQEQLAFEQQKYEQQQARRAMETRNFSGFQQGGPTSWEGMYDDVPQPSIPTGPQGGMGRGGGGMGRGMSPIQGAPGPANKPSPQSKFSTPQPQSSPPANAPTGPRNAGKPGANYRGGGRGAHRGFHPYSRG